MKSPSDTNDIGQFVEKVVFNLHDSFPKPKRVIKEPPYVVKGELGNIEIQHGSLCLCFGNAMVKILSRENLKGFFLENILI